MTIETAKTRAYSTAFAVFFRVMRRLVGEAGIAQLAGSEPDDHVTLVSVGNGKSFAMHVVITFGPIENAPGLEEIIDGK